MRHTQTIAMWKSYVADLEIRSAYFGVSIFPKIYCNRGCLVD